MSRKITLFIIIIPKCISTRKLTRNYLNTTRIEFCKLKVLTEIIGFDHLLLLPVLLLLPGNPSLLQQLPLVSLRVLGGRELEGSAEGLDPLGAGPVNNIQ